VGKVARITCPPPPPSLLSLALLPVCWHRYNLDGRDPNGYLGIAWCFGVCDRQFPERPVFGCVRPMTQEGLARKWDVMRYVRRVEATVAAVSAACPRTRALLFAPSDASGAAGVGGAGGSGSIMSAFARGAGTTGGK
jgi:hypothetical protein